MSVFPTACRTPGCSGIATDDYCGKCVDQGLDRRAVREKTRRRRESLEPDALERDRFYSTNRWRLTRNAFIRRNPLCVDCMVEGRTEPATVAHHEPELATLPRTEWCRADRLVAVCSPCHSRRHARAA